MVRILPPSRPARPSKVRTRASATPTSGRVEAFERGEQSRDVQRDAQALEHDPARAIHAFIGPPTALAACVPLDATADGVDQDIHVERRAPSRVGELAAAVPRLGRGRQDLEPGGRVLERTRPRADELRWSADDDEVGVNERPAGRGIEVPDGKRSTVGRSDLDVTRVIWRVGSGTDPLAWAQASRHRAARASKPTARPARPN